MYRYCDRLGELTLGAVIFQSVFYPNPPFPCFSSGWLLQDAWFRILAPCFRVVHVAHEISFASQILFEWWFLIADKTLCRWCPILSLFIA